MPTRKQRRRREKTFRHEFGFVEYDEEGNEIELDPTEVRKPKQEAAKAKPKARQRGSRPVREVPPPSWRRALRRGGLMGGALLIVMVGFLRSPPVVGILYAAAFIPFTYWIDRIAYRNYLRRSGKS
jgi:hypothetical protein